MKILTTRPKVVNVVRAALSPTCPACSVPYVKSEGCMHMNCPTCGTHFCHACHRRHVDTHQPGTHEEMVAALSTWNPKNMLARDAASRVLSTFALSQENTLNLLRIRARRDLEAIDSWPKHLRLYDSSRKRADHCLANSKFITCPIYPENFMKRSDGILDHHGTIFGSRLSSLHEAVGKNYVADDRDAAAVIAGVDILIRVTKMLHVAGVHPKKIVQQGAALGGKAIPLEPWNEKKFFELITKTDGALEALAKTVEFYRFMEQRALA